MKRMKTETQTEMVPQIEMILTTTMMVSLTVKTMMMMVTAFLILKTRITQILMMKMTNYNFLDLLTNQAGGCALSACTSGQSYYLSNIKNCCASLSELI